MQGAIFAPWQCGRGQQHRAGKLCSPVLPLGVAPTIHGGRRRRRRPSLDYPGQRLPLPRIPPCLGRRVIPPMHRHMGEVPPGLVRPLNQLARRPHGGVVAYLSGQQIPLPIGLKVCLRVRATIDDGAVRHGLVGQAGPGPVSLPPALPPFFLQLCLAIRQSMSPIRSGPILCQRPQTPKPEAQVFLMEKEQFPTMEIAV